mmetsp:Transcript_11908/g.36090  ORF Transcript_11908/g.36090 Transcript_11908/m.36090 type:complete len:86 (+) Transcript_11908:1647-1904(+)
MHLFPPLPSLVARQFTRNPNPKVPVGDGLGVALLNGVKQGETPPFDASIAKALLELQLIEGSAAAGEAPSSGLDLSVSSVGMGLA